MNQTELLVQNICVLNYLVDDRYNFSTFAGQVVLIIHEIFPQVSMLYIISYYDELIVFLITFY